jgi:hypothetical protein
MRTTAQIPVVDEETALGVVIELLSEPDGTKRFGWGGYDVFLNALVFEYLRRQRLVPDHVHDPAGYVERPSPPFYAAAWTLCLRGILRPGVRGTGEDPRDDGSAGAGFSVTAYGRRWLQEHSSRQVLPMQPRRFLQLVERFGSRFGAGYLVRVREALGCYEAGQRLACCAMCGAAAESILLRLGSELQGEEEVLRAYLGRDGRRKVEQFVLHGTAEHVQRAFRGYMDLLKYWRDEAAHGRPSEISDDEAFTSLLLIAHLAQFSNDTFALPGRRRK